ncbi:MAG TPA: hypothetical protein VKB86_22930 [Pyrinomonadaceae bacterium]|nr:hypothetical protein [Pyrinomonadaceae bacterium]
MNWLKQLFRAESTRRITVDNPLIIESPRIAFLNLSGSVAESLLNEDKDAFAPLFTAIETSDSDIPNCDVLIIYCDLNNNGVVAGQSKSLRDIIDDAGAPIVIVASENSADSYRMAGKRNGHATSNLVMTLNRKGTAFTTFFADLFRRMFAGQSMPLAWVELAPQIPGAVHNNCPDTIFAAEISHVVFKGA